VRTAVRRVRSDRVLLARRVAGGDARAERAKQPAYVSFGRSGIVPIGRRVIGRSADADAARSLQCAPRSAPSPRAGATRPASQRGERARGTRTARRCAGRCRPPHAASHAASATGACGRADGAHLTTPPVLIVRRGHSAGEQSCEQRKEASADARTVRGAEPPAPPNGSAPPTVLVADDDPAIRAALTRLLPRLGYRVLAAADGRDALDVAARHAGPIHLLLTDLEMPRLHGRELARAFGARYPAAAVLFISAGPPPPDLAAAVAGRPAAFLSKPFALDALHALLTELTAPGASSPDAMPRADVGAGAVPG
jgi:CheY-like chemotaxis protein